jgi:hypothetical protein
MRTESNQNTRFPTLEGNKYDTAEEGNYGQADTWYSGKPNKTI